MDIAILQTSGGFDGLHCHWIEASPVHTGRHIHRRGNEILDLPRAIATLFQEDRELDHVLDARTGMARNEIGNEILLLARPFRCLLKSFRKNLKAGAPGFLHQLEHAITDMLRRHLEMSPDMMGREFIEIFRFFRRQVHANPRRDMHSLDPFDLARSAHQIEGRRMIRIQKLADLGVHAGQPSADPFDLGLRTAHSIHIRGRTAQIADRALEIGPCCQGFDLLQDRIWASTLDFSPLVHGDRAKRAAAKTSPHDLDGIFDGLPGRRRCLVVGMGMACVGKLMNTIHLGLGERMSRRIHDEQTFTMALHEPARVMRIGLVVKLAGHLGKCTPVFLDDLIGGQFERLVSRRPPKAHFGKRFVFAQQIRDPPERPQ